MEKSNITAYKLASRYSDVETYVAAFGDDARPLWNVACLPFREFLAAMGIRRVDLSKRYGIPLVTLDQWLAGKRNPPSYVRLLLAIAEGYIEK